MSLALTTDVAPPRLKRNPQSDSTPATSSSGPLSPTSSFPQPPTASASPTSSGKPSLPIFTIAFVIVIGFAVLLAVVVFVFLTTTRRGRRYTADSARAILASELQGASEGSTRRAYLARTPLAPPTPLVNCGRGAQTAPTRRPTAPCSIYTRSNPDAAASRFWTPSALGQPDAQLSKASLTGPWRAGAHESRISLDSHAHARSATQHEAIYSHPIARPYSPSVVSVGSARAEEDGGAQGGGVHGRGAGAGAGGVPGPGSQRSSASSVAGFSHLMEVLGPPGISPGPRGGAESPPPYEGGAPGDGEMDKPRA
ncbi:hypothetical protein FKP32DRAFT_1673509 [Trametes sanguinea]|nr:hypothetical protein FKP32DRAFT_1673509 [Trametes sanguinea]